MAELVHPARRSGATAHSGSACSGRACSGSACSGSAHSGSAVVSRAVVVSAIVVSAIVAGTIVGGGVLACDPPPQAQVTYHGDIAPLFAAQCNGCHQTGGIAPFPLDTHADVVAHKDAVLFSVQARRMPPFPLDNSGDCQSFRDARWLSDDEVALVSRWIDGGAVEGEPPARAPRPPADAGLIEGPGVVRLQMAEPYTPQPTAGYPDDDYRCFFVDPGLVDDFYVTGFEILPGQPSEVHHMLLFSLLTDEAEAAGEQMDAATDGPGWTCFGAAGSDIADEELSLVAGWAPGSNVVRYPDRTGLFVPGGRRLVMQIHYNLLAGALPDTTSVRLAHATAVEREAAMLPVADGDFLLAPDDPAAVHSFTTPLLGLRDSLHLHGIFPHMHTLGRTLRMTRRPIGDADGSDEVCLGDVPRWDFHWQHLAFYDDPIVVDGGHQIDVTCTWDTRGRTEPILWGEGTQDEMCLVFVYITRVGAGPLADAFPN
jgi:hypothetical protein